MNRELKRRALATFSDRRKQREGCFLAQRTMDGTLSAELHKLEFQLPELPLPSLVDRYLR